jgi:glyoxylase-like metal-dependent hydrolase (beta-lactamase superfamily II)
LVFAALFFAPARALQPAAQGGRGLQPVRLAQDVYVFYGARGEISAENGGRVGNSGFIVGPKGVIVVDTGGSDAHAREMIDAIARITPKRIRLAIITTPFQEFLFGASAFRDAGASILAHAETAKLIHQRCEDFLARSRRYAGEAPFLGTQIVVPEERIEHSTRYTIAGRNVDLYHFGWGATPGDLIVFDRASGVAFVGGLVSMERIPDTHDFNFTSGWHDALGKLRALGAQQVVPGHGRAIKPDDVSVVQDYLSELTRITRSQFDAGASLSEAVERVQLPAFQNWDMYATTHRQNVHRLYLHLEQTELQR